MVAVVVPVDGSELAEAALRLLPDLAPRAVYLLHVSEELVPEEPAAVEATFARAEGLLARLAPGVTSVRVAQAGPVAETVLEVTRQVGANLIALSTHGRAGFDRLVLGSVAESVIRRSEVPVLTLHAGRTATPDAPAPHLLEHVLVPFDGSERSLRVLDNLAVLGKGRTARITLLGVVELLAAAEHWEASPPDPWLAKLAEAQRERARTAAEWAAARARNLGFEAEVSIAEGRPALRIVELAEAAGVSLIAMTTHGRAGLARWVLGSVTELVLRAAPAPLLVVR